MSASDDNTAKHVAEVLRSFGLNAVSWDSGGGMVGVGIAPGGTPPDELRFFFGTGGDMWAGEVLDADGEVEAGLPSSVPSDSVDVVGIAGGIIQALAEFASTQRG